MQCPSCKETIDDDSRYCDQCGEQLLVCSSCGRNVKGKRCQFCGGVLIPIGSGSQPVPTTANIPVPPIQPMQMPHPTQFPLSVQPVPMPPPVVQATPVAMPVQQPVPQTIGGGKIKLTSQMHGITIEAKDGDIIGSKNGAFAGIFGRFKFISSTHCKFIKTAAGWHIQDIGSTGMGSTNGTYYNGVQLAPNALYPLLSNTTVKKHTLTMLTQA